MTATESTAGLYSHPGFTPIKDEMKGIRVDVVGEIPAGLDGLFLRNGANSLFDRPRPHMFDGSAMLHAVEIRNGEARYFNCVVRTPFTEYLLEIGHNPFIGFGEMTSARHDTLDRLAFHQAEVKRGALKGFKRIEQVFAGTSVLHHGDRLYCLQETGLPFLIDVARDAEGWIDIPGSGRLEDFGGVLDAPFSAHPKKDPVSGEVHSIGQNCLTGETVHTVLAPGGGARNTVIATAKPPALYSHDLILTERWIIFADSSLLYVPEELARSGSFARFDETRMLRFGILARDHAPGDPVRWFETAAPGHIWHIANGWEEEGRAHLFAPVFREYPSSVPIHSMAEPHAEFVCWVLDLEAGRVVEETVLMKHFYERPSMDMRRSGRRARYAWLLDEERGGIMGKGVLKYDLIDRVEAGYADYGAMFGGEPLFVPRDPTRLGAEDDGWICDLLADGSSAELLVLDAGTMAQTCRIKLPQRVPFGVHGLWLDRAQVDRLIES